MERNEPPCWMQDKHFNEVLFCEGFLSVHPMVCVDGSFFTVEGRVADEEGIRRQIYEMLRPHFTAARPAAPQVFSNRSGWRPTRRSCPFRRTASMLPTARCFSMVSFVSKNFAATVSPSDMT